MSEVRENYVGKVNISEGFFVVCSSFLKWWFVLVVTIGVDRRTYSRSGMVSTGMRDVRGFDSRPPHPGI